jgi:hypothetical protein
MSRPTNTDLVEDFRRLLTEDFYAVDADGVVLDDNDIRAVLAETKPWRNELWRAFREIADRLDPVAKFERTGTI